jgi:hypothetical protein
MNRPLILAAALAFVLPASAQTTQGFAQADTQAEAQRSRMPDATSAYAEAWANFNNAHGLDERDGCYFKAEGELTQVLQLDASGKVVGYFADKDNGRSRCWERTYLGVAFPKPPFAPYWHKLVMH